MSVPKIVRDILERAGEDGFVWRRRKTCGRNGNLSNSAPRTSRAAPLWRRRACAPPPAQEAESQAREADAPVRSSP